MERNRGWLNLSAGDRRESLKGDPADADDARPAAR